MFYTLSVLYLPSSNYLLLLWVILVERGVLFRVRLLPLKRPNISIMTLSDLLNLLSFFMQPVTKASAMYDLNGDGLISTSDLIIMLGMLG